MSQGCLRTVVLTGLTVCGIGLIVTGGVEMFSICSAQVNKTVLDGIYTEEQAKRGGTTYQDKCSGCHSADLTGGGFAPALIAEPFTGPWIDHPVDELVTIVKGTMPADRPGSLSDDAYADIVAFLLKRNGYPAGQQLLPTDSTALKQIVLKKPTPGK
jgi:mono/diheme cytochrome c family protein